MHYCAKRRWIHKVDQSLRVLWNRKFWPTVGSTPKSMPNEQRSEHKMGCRMVRIQFAGNWGSQASRSTIMPLLSKTYWTRRIKYSPLTSSPSQLPWAGLRCGKVRLPDLLQSWANVGLPVSERVARSFSSPDLRVHIGGDASWKIPVPLFNLPS